MKTVRELLPLPVVLIVVGTSTGLCSTAGSRWGAWGLAAMLAGNSWVHAMILVPAPPGSRPDLKTFPFDLGGSWLIHRGAPSQTVRAAGSALAVLVALALLGAHRVGI